MVSADINSKGKQESFQIGVWLELQQTHATWGNTGLCLDKAWVLGGISEVPTELQESPFSPAERTLGELVWVPCELCSPARASRFTGFRHNLMSPAARGGSYPKLEQGAARTDFPEEGSKSWTWGGRQTTRVAKNPLWGHTRVCSGESCVRGNMFMPLVINRIISFLSKMYTVFFIGKSDQIPLSCMDKSDQRPLSCINKNDQIPLSCINKNVQRPLSCIDKNVQIPLSFINKNYQFMLMYSTENYMQSPVINHNGKGSEKE